MARGSFDLPRPVETPQASLLIQYAAAIIVNLVGLMSGVAIAWNATALPMLLAEDVITLEDASWMSSSLCLAYLPGTALVSYVMGRWGRKPAGYCVTGLPFLLHWSLLCAAPRNVPVLHAARFLLGIGVGSGFTFCAVFSTEIAQDKVRGSLGVLVITLVNVGLLVGYALGAIFQSLAVYNGVGLGLCFVFYLSFFWLPETPTFLLSKGRVADARRSLQSLRGKNVPVSEELDERSRQLEEASADSSEAASFRELFSTRGSLMALLISVMLFVNQQLCGSYAIQSNTERILSESGSSLSAAAGSVLVGAVNLAGTLMSVVLVDRLGRKVLLVVSDAAMALSLGVFGFYLQSRSSGGADAVSGLGWLPTACLCLYVVALNVGLSPLPFPMVPELFPSRLVGLANTVCMAVFALLQFLVAKFFFQIANALTVQGSYWLFATVCVLGVLFVVLVMPETKCRPVEDIVAELQGGSAWKERQRQVAAAGKDNGAEELPAVDSSV